MSYALKITQKYLASIIYATGITFSIYIALEELHKYQNTSRFLVFSIIIFAILFLENLISVLKRSKKIELNFNMHDEINEVWHLFYKFILPLLYYISLIGFGYYNFHNQTILIILALTFITFFLLFINTRAFFTNLKTLESKTHYVYDIIKFLILFTAVDTLANIYSNSIDKSIIIIVAVFLVIFVLTMLMVIRIKKHADIAAVLSFIISFLGAGLFWFLSMSDSYNSLQISLGLLFFFYLSIAIIHHVLLHTLSKGVILEYLVILGVVFSILYGLS